MWIIICGSLGCSCGRQLRVESQKSKNRGGVMFAAIGRSFRATGSLGLLLVCAGGAAAVFMAAAGSGTAGAPAQSANANWVLTWSDEFDAPDGSAPDPKKWTAETGGGGWGNNELEYYTARQTNSRVEKGNLVIDALQEKFTGPDGVTREYTSARLKTAKLFTQKYGKFEARIRIPKGQGMWPAFWMLGDDISTAGWPACGEIDIMENVGSAPATVHGTLHGPGYSGDKSLGAPYALPSGNVADDFHLFAVEWEPKEI